MINLADRKRLATPIVGVLLSALMIGCGADESEPVVQETPRPRPTTPAPPPVPTVTPVADLMARLRIDERVVLPEDQAPATDEARIAVLQFFDGFARGDNVTLAKMMSVADSVELDALVESGIWQETIDNIERIEIQTGPSEFGDCALAVFEVDFEFQPQLWYYRAENNGHRFEAAASPPGIMDKLSGADWIRSWHQVLAGEQQLAEKPDIDVAAPQKNLDDEDAREKKNRGRGRGPALNPGGGTNPFGRRPPPRNPQRPPGPR